MEKELREIEKDKIKKAFAEMLDRIDNSSYESVYVQFANWTDFEQMEIKGYKITLDKIETIL